MFIDCCYTSGRVTFSVDSKKINPKIFVFVAVIGLAAAVFYFSTVNKAVSIPLIDNQEYDLLVEEGDEIKKVQKYFFISAECYNFTLLPNQKDTMTKKQINPTLHITK